MANTAKKQNNIKNIFKILLAISVLAVLWLFVNDSTYNILKKPFVKNADKYMEMYAYMQTKPISAGKYFVLQKNNAAKSFFEDRVDFVSENDLDSINCSADRDIYLIYENPSDKINEFIKKKDSITLSLNQGTNVAFYVVQLNRGAASSCNVGG